MTNGRRDKTREGQIMVSVPPYGYQIKKEVEETPNGRTITIDRKLEPHPEESEVVQEIFNLYATGEYSLNGIPEEYQKELIKELDVRIELEYTNEMWVHITCQAGHDSVPLLHYF